MSRPLRFVRGSRRRDATRPPLSLSARIAAIRREIAALEAEQRADLLLTIASVVPSHVEFNANELFALRDHQPPLAAAFDDLQIHNARSLGRRLQQLAATSPDAPVRLERVGHDNTGTLWTVLVVAD